jgi:signal peptidase I
MKELLKALGNYLLDTLEVITTAVALFVVIFLFVARIHEVNGNSMLPNFHNGEFVLTDQLTHRFRHPQRGEIIIFKAPPQPKKEYIKRVIGLPGEKIKIQNNRITIFNKDHPDGFILEEGYLAPGTITEGKTEITTNTLFTVPEGQYIVMGDNRTASSDSRQWGGVPEGMIVGRAIIRIWPPNKIGLVPHAKY